MQARMRSEVLLHKKIPKAHRQLASEASALSRPKPEHGVLQDQFAELMEGIEAKGLEVAKRAAELEEKLIGLWGKGLDDETLREQLERLHERGTPVVAVGRYGFDS